MRAVYIIQGVCAIIVLTMLTGSLMFAKHVKEKAKALGGGPIALYDELGSINTKGDLLSMREMQQARQYVIDGEYGKAHDKLRFLINFYAEASFAKEARGVLGALNLDQILSPSSPKYKTSYTVKRGDSLSRIAKKHDSTVENIMELNGFLYSNRIHPEQEMIVMKLGFRTVIDIEQKSLTLYDGETFVKEYPLLEISYRGKSKVMLTEINQSMAYDGEELISRISSRYRPNKKMIVLKHGDLQIRAVKHPDEPDLGQGFFLSHSDMEEFNLLVREGGEVEVRL